MEVVADEPLDVEGVEYEVDTWFAPVAEVPMLGAIGDDVGVPCLDESSAYAKTATTISRATERAATGAPKALPSPVRLPVFIGKRL